MGKLASDWDSPPGENRTVAGISARQTCVNVSAGRSAKSGTEYTTCLYMVLTSCSFSPEGRNPTYISPYAMCARQRQKNMHD